MSEKLRISLYHERIIAVLKFPQLAENRAKYHLLTNNCHAHAQGVLRELGF